MCDQGTGIAAVKVFCVFRCTESQIDELVSICSTEKLAQETAERLRKDSTNSVVFSWNDTFKVVSWIMVIPKESLQNIMFGR